MKKIVKRGIIIILAIVILFTSFSTIANAKQIDRTSNESSYDYTNDIYNNGFEDTYLIDTTDSIITTKTGLDRNIPETFGKYSREEYPIPNISKPKNEEAFEAIKAENLEVMNNVEEQIANGTLKKHIAADGQFYGTISDDVKAVEKLAYINTYLYGSHSLGVYIPAGEVATVTIPEEYRYLIEKGYITLKVGLTETDATNYARNNGNENRMPYLGKSFLVTDTTMKIGTPFGGMAYVQFPSNIPSNLVIPITITGGVDTPYYDFGKTTLEEWKILKEAPGLYAEFRTPLVRFIMPSSTIRNIEDPYDILAFWTNASTLSTYAFNNQTRRYPITMIFDPYVFAGAAVATVGAWICNMPTSWATGSLDYDGFMKNGSWGTIHEFNHHWQGAYQNTSYWGVGSTGEVTNNVMNSATYILYTNIDSYRTEKAFGGWNNVANPYYNLVNVISESKNTNPVTSVYMYNTFMHEFGVQTFLEVVRSNYYGGTYNGIKIAAYNTQDTRYDDFAYRTSVVCGKDLSYYFKEVLHFDLLETTIQKIKSLGFEEYIPVQNLFAVGPANTGKPYYVSGDSYTFDFDKFTASIGNVENIEVGTPKYGKLNKNDDGTYTYTKSSNMTDEQIEEFELKITVSANGITQTRTLPCKLQFKQQDHFEQPEPYYKRSLTKLSNKIDLDLSSATVIKVPMAQSGNNLEEAKTIIDGDLTTFYHTRYYGNNITPFPHEYVIDLGKEMSFNQVYIGTRTSNTNGTIGDYEIYISQDNENWTKVAEDNNRYGNSSVPVNITAKLQETVSARYVKVSALNNRGGANFTIVSEITLSNNIDNQNIISQNSSLIQYEGEWKRNVQGCFINGATYNTTNGNMKFAFNGTDLGIYSVKDATVQIRIDKDEWKTYELTGKTNSPSLILKDLTDTNHNVQIKVISRELAIDVLSTNGKFVEYNANIMKGDVNLDDTISPTDLLLLKRHLVAEEKKEWILTGDNFKAGDINDDNDISPTDLLLLMRLVLENN